MNHDVLLIKAYISLEKIYVIFCRREGRENCQEQKIDHEIWDNLRANAQLLMISYFSSILDVDKILPIIIFLHESPIYFVIDKTMSNLHEPLNAEISVTRPVFHGIAFRGEKNGEQCNATWFKCAKCRQKYTRFLEKENGFRVQLSYAAKTSCGKLLSRLTFLFLWETSGKKSKTVRVSISRQGCRWCVAAEWQILRDIYVWFIHIDKIYNNYISLQNNYFFPLKELDI